MRLTTYTISQKIENVHQSLLNSIHINKNKNVNNNNRERNKFKPMNNMNITNQPSTKQDTLNTFGFNIPGKKKVKSNDIISYQTPSSHQITINANIIIHPNDHREDSLNTLQSKYTHIFYININRTNFETNDHSRLQL